MDGERKAVVTSLECMRMMIFRFWQERDIVMKQRVVLRMLLERGWTVAVRRPRSVVPT